MYVESKGRFSSVLRPTQKDNLAHLAMDGVGHAAKRSRIHLPRCESVWGLMVEQSAYTRLVITALEEPSLQRARGFAGQDATFIGEVRPTMPSLVIENMGMQGRRHMSRLPLSDIRMFANRFVDLQFVDSSGMKFTGLELEAVFGPCPAHDAMAAFHARSFCFNLSGEAFTKSYNPQQQQQQQQQQGSDGAGGIVAQRDCRQSQTEDNKGAGTAVTALFNEARLALEALSRALPAQPVGEGSSEYGFPGFVPELQLRECLGKLEGMFSARSGTEARVRYNEASGIEERIGGYSYQPTFLLDAVLMTDNLREPSLLKPALEKSFQLVGQPDLAQHFTREIQQARLPRAPCLYDARITFDMCTMLWSREHLLSSKAEKSRPWVLHLRCDSSPQFGRDYLVTQADYVQYGTDAGATSITKRLLPIQCVGSRAGSESHKLDKILFSLTLESEQVSRQCILT